VLTLRLIDIVSSHDFLRDGNMLAARMTGTPSIEGADSEFETYLVARVDATREARWSGSRRGLSMALSARSSRKIA
jgi:hypothetical protein